jgi:hypothetical protein
MASRLFPMASTPPIPSYRPTLVIASMTQLRSLVAAALLALVGAGGAAAQTLSYADAGALIAKSCGGDIERFCATSNIGGGALKQCLSKAGSKVSQRCVADAQAAFASLEKRAAAQAAVPQVCKLDAERYCRGVKPGDGNYLTCLNTATKAVGAECQQTLADAGWN